MKRVTESDMPIYEIVSMVAAATMVAIFIKARMAKPDTASTLKALWPNNLKTQMLFSCTGFAAQYSCILALAHLPLNIFYVSVFTAPLMIALMGSVFLHERLGYMKILAIGIGFGGVVLAIAPWSETSSTGSALGYLAAFASAASFAMTVVFSRKMTRASAESPESITFYNALQQLIMSLLILLVMGGGIKPDWFIAGLVIAAGVTNAGGCLYNYLATQHTHAATVGAYHYTQIISGAIIAYMVWGEMPTLNLVLGVIIIILSGLYIALGKRNAETPPLVLPVP